jgi:HK97 family phage major capsid protein
MHMRTKNEVQAEIDMTIAACNTINGRGTALQARADNEKRDLTTEEIRRADNLAVEFERQQDNLESLKDELREIDEAPGRVSAGRQVPPSRPGDHPGAPVPRSAEGLPSLGPRFANMFPGSRRNEQTQFSNLGEFARAVYERNPRLFDVRNASGMSEGTGADGGFYVPTQFLAGIMDDSLQVEAVRPNATIIPMNSQSIIIPMFDLSNRSTGIATMEGIATPEGTTGTTQKAKVREVGMTAKKVSILVPTTAELMQDAPEVFAVMLGQHMSDAMSQTLDTWFIKGTGAGQPLGILNAPCLVSVAKDTSQVAATITPTNIGGMVGRLAPGSWSRATWIVSPSALNQLFNMTNVVRNVANTENVGGFQPGFFHSGSDGSFTLCGRPVIVSDRCQAIGTKGDILLCDLRSYLIGMRQAGELLVDRSVGFKESEIWFRLNVRIDGQPSLSAPITPRVGSATLSPFVSLDTRS